MARISKATVLWQRLDMPGYDWARLSVDPKSAHVEGVALFAHDDEPVRLNYAIDCDSSWRTRGVRVRGHVGNRAVELDVACDGGTWAVGGREQEAVEGCLDIDLAFSPATNTLPIRRLKLDVGARADVRAAWLRFPELDLVPLEQVYRRTAARAWRYESNGGAFVRDLEVDADGLIVEYPGLWKRVALA